MGFGPCNTRARRRRPSDRTGPGWVGSLDKMGLGPTGSYLFTENLHELGRVEPVPFRTAAPYCFVPSRSGAYFSINRTLLFLIHSHFHSASILHLLYKIF